MQMSLTPSVARAVKSVQRGTITIASGQNAVTATITAVVTAKSTARFLGFSVAGVSAGTPPDGSEYARVELTNSTTVTATRVNVNTYGPTLAFEVVEYW